MCRQGLRLKEILYISQFFRAILNRTDRTGKQVKRSASLCLDLQLQVAKRGQTHSAREGVQVNVDPSEGRERRRDLGTSASSEKDPFNQTTKADLWFNLRRRLMDVDLPHDDESDVQPASCPSSAILCRRESARSLLSLPCFWPDLPPVPEWK